MAAQVDLENWKNIIDQIEKEIRKFEPLPKSPQKTADLEFYGRTAAQLRSFKDAWRNHVSHSKGTYDESEAILVWTHVRTLMEQLAAHPASRSEAP